MKKPIQFGKYYLLDRINVGGMAEVFRAKAFGVEGFERIVAVKRILPAIAEDKEFISMFIDEAKIAVQLQHANVCQIFDLGKVEDAYFIALEYVHGKDLRAIFDRCRQRPEGGSPTMPVAQACFCVMKMCEGLDYAHNKKDAQGRDLHLVHRDVSPQNVIVSYEGEVKLVDFGIAKQVGKASKTQQGILKGKFGYMSPEQVRGLPLDRRSDIFSIGIVLYEMLTGERLFTAETDFQTLEKIRNVEILQPSTYNRKIPDELERIVLKALSKDVDDRYQNAIDLHDDLQAFMYTAGEFYSRKDLAGWMKRLWTKEIAEEAARLESYRNISPPPPQQTPPPARSQGGRGAPPPLPSSGEAAVAPERPARGNGRSSASMAAVPPPSATPAPAVDDGDLEWDDEELETHVYEQPKDASDAVLEEEELGLEGDEGPDDDRLSLDDLDLSPDGAPVPAKGQASAPPAAEPPTSEVPLPPARPSKVLEIAPVPVKPPPQEPLELPPIPTTIVPPRPLAPRPTARPRTGLYLGVAGVGLVGVIAVALLLLVGRKGTLQITTDPPDGARILIEDRLVQLDPSGSLELDPGTYRVTVQRDGYVDWHDDNVAVKAGEHIKRRAELVALAQAELTVRSAPSGAVAYLDGVRLGQTDFHAERLKPGKHRLELQLGGHTTYSEDILLESGRSRDITATLVPLIAPPPVAAPPATVAVAVAPPVVERPVVPQEPPPTVAAVVRPKREPRPREPAPEVAPPPREKRLPRLPSEPAERPVERDKPPAEAPRAAAGGEGTLRLQSKPWTKIAIDGKETGLTTPLRDHRLPAGRHKITLSNPNFSISETFTVEIRANETETVIKDFRPPSQDE